MVIIIEMVVAIIIGQKVKAKVKAYHLLFHGRQPLRVLTRETGKYNFCQDEN